MQGPQALWGRDVFAVLGFEDYQQGIGCLGFGFPVMGSLKRSLTGTGSLRGSVGFYNNRCRKVLSILLQGVWAVLGFGG